MKMVALVELSESISRAERTLRKIPGAYLTYINLGSGKVLRMDGDLLVVVDHLGEIKTLDKFKALERIGYATHIPALIVAAINAQPQIAERALDAVQRIEECLANL